jgi:hypothetical protein
VSNCPGGSRIWRAVSIGQTGAFDVTGRARCSAISGMGQRSERMSFYPGKGALSCYVPGALSTRCPSLLLPAGAAAAVPVPAAATVVAGHGEEHEEAHAGDEDSPRREDQQVRVTHHAALHRVLAPGGTSGACKFGVVPPIRSSRPHRPAGSRAARMVAVWSQPGRTGGADVAWGGRMPGPGRGRAWSAGFRPWISGDGLREEAAA